MLGEPRNGPVQQLLKSKSGVVTVPQVFVNSQFLGGDDAMKVAAQSGKLKDMLAAAGAKFDS